MLDNVKQILLNSIFALGKSREEVCVLFAGGDSPYCTTRRFVSALTRLHLNLSTEETRHLLEILTKEKETVDWNFFLNYTFGKPAGTSMMHANGVSSRVFQLAQANMMPSSSLVVPLPPVDSPRLPRPLSASHAHAQSFRDERRRGSNNENEDIYATAGIDFEEYKLPLDNHQFVPAPVPVSVSVPLNRKQVSNNSTAKFFTVVNKPLEQRPTTPTAATYISNTIAPFSSSSSPSSFGTHPLAKISLDSAHQVQVFLHALLATQKYNLREVFDVLSSSSDAPSCQITQKSLRTNFKLLAFSSSPPSQYTAQQEKEHGSDQIDISDAAAEATVSAMCINTAIATTASSFAEFVVFVTDPSFKSLERNLQAQVVQQLEKYGEDYLLFLGQVFFAEDKIIEEKFKEGVNKDQLLLPMPLESVGRLSFLSSLFKLGLRLSPAEGDRLAARFDEQGDGGCRVDQFLRIATSTRAWTLVARRAAVAAQSSKEAALVRRHHRSTGKWLVAGLDPLQLCLLEQMGMCCLSEQHLNWIAILACRLPLPEPWTLLDVHYSTMASVSSPSFAFSPFSGTTDAPKKTLAAASGDDSNKISIDSNRFFYHNSITNVSQYEHPLLQPLFSMRDRFRLSSSNTTYVLNSHSVVPPPLPLASPPYLLSSPPSSHYFYV